MSSTKETAGRTHSNETFYPVKDTATTIKPEPGGKYMHDIYLIRLSTKRHKELSKFNNKRKFVLIKK